ncbi:MAG TPA: hypothetical protein VD994_11670 [Prosthecobacter sp.]|nr:hypothetical protein [Prosthecobacter sp.]
MRFCLFLSLLFASSLTAADTPRWYKGNTHTHSLWSDGNDFPDMIASWYKEKGYDFLSMSDHNVLARGDKWVAESVLEKKKIALGPKVLDKYRAKFGADWVETRRTAEGALEVRLKTLEEYRKKLEEPGKFLVVEAEEVTASFDKAPIHINAVNVTDVIEPTKDLVSIRETMRANLKAIAEQAQKTGRPIIAHVNHPNFRWALTAEDLAHVIEDRFFEVFNGHPMTYAEGSPERADSSTDRIWDIANTIRIAELKQPPLYGMGTDDSHHYHGGTSISGRAWVMVRSTKLESNALMEAMQRGDFYATTGVTLEDVAFDKAAGELRVKIKGEPGVKYRVEYRGTLKNYDRAVKEVPGPAGETHPVRLQYSQDVGKVLAGSEELDSSYKLTGNELYVRAIIYSDKVMTYPILPDQKQQAWTQPVGWEK